MGRHNLTDAQWERLNPFFPPEMPVTGRPSYDRWRMMDGMLWIARTGAPWRDLSERYGSFDTVPSRFYRWRKAGVWQRALEALQAHADRRGRVAWSLHFADSIIVRAHQHAAGTRKAGNVQGGPEALGRSRDGFSSKIHIRAEEFGKPVTFALTDGEVPISKAFATLMGTGWIKRLG